MSLDLTVLRLLKSRERYERLARSVPPRALDQRTAIILKDFGAYFKEFPDTEAIDSGPFMLWFRGFRHPNLKEDALAVFDSLLASVASEGVDPSIESGLMARLVAADTASRLADLITKFQEGEEVDLYQELRSNVERFEQQVDRKVKNPQVLDRIEDLLQAEQDDKGFHWRLACLNQHIKPVRCGDFIVVAARPDKGKCLHPDTLVRMHPYGVKRAQDVRDGDVVMGPGGTPKNVTGVTHGISNMYRVSYPWGDSYVVNEDHVLSLKRSKAEGPHKTGDILNVPVKEYLAWPDSRKGRYKGWKADVEYREAKQAMPPYLLGVWLGDGTTDKPQITTADYEILAAFIAQYGEYSKVYNGITYSWANCALRGDLSGLLGNKHIPRNYLEASREQRLELLAGIIDSDGHAGDVYEIITKLDSLKDGYVELARSLGFHCTANRTFKRATNCNHAGDWYWRVRIGSEAFGVVPVRLERKRGTLGPRKRHGLHFGIKVEPVGMGEYCGFCLDGDHLFLLGDFTVTHNTTFMASELTHMAAQVDALFPGEGRSILWFNNEGPGRNIVTRCFQAALDGTMEDLVRYNKESTIRERYIKALGGRGGALRIFDIHDMWNHEVEDLMRLHKPALVLFDMVDNIKFGGEATNNGQRTDQLLEAMYQWARMMGVKHDCAVMATSQISADGDGVQYPTLPMLKDSKTGKQGAADVIITLGTVNDPVLISSRYIGTTKNKRKRTGFPASPMQEVIFDGDRGRYREVEQ